MQFRKLVIGNKHQISIMNSSGGRIKERILGRWHLYAWNLSRMGSGGLMEKLSIKILRRWRKKHLGICTIPLWVPMKIQMMKLTAILRFLPFIYLIFMSYANHILLCCISDVPNNYISIEVKFSFCIFIWRKLSIYSLVLISVKIDRSCNLWNYSF